MTASKKKIEEFLVSFAKAAKKRGEVEFVERSDINKNFASLGITKPMAQKEVLTLKHEHYQVGPQDDRDPERSRNETGDFWIFEKEVNGKKAYIKLKLAKSKHNDSIVFAKCWMHESDEQEEKEEKKVTPKVVAKKKGGRK